MSRILVLCMLTISISTLAQTEVEEAIILNGEMQVLEDYAKLAPKISDSPTEVGQEENSSGEKSLEEKYFGTKEDSVSNKASGIKRRGF